MGVTDDDQDDVGLGGQTCRALRVAAVVVGDRGPIAECRAQAGQRCHHVVGMGVARPAVAGIGHVRETPDNRDAPGSGDRKQAALVLQQDDALVSNLPRDLAMCRAADDLAAVFGRIPALAEAHLLAQDAATGVIDPFFRNLSALDQALQVLRIERREWHLDVLARQRRLLCIAHAGDEVGHREALEVPHALEDISDELRVLAGPFAIDLVVGRHHGSDTGIHDALEVRQVDLMQRSCVRGHINVLTRIFH